MIREWKGEKIEYWSVNGIGDDEILQDLGLGTAGEVQKDPS